MRTTDQRYDDWGKNQKCVVWGVGANQCPNSLWYTEVRSYNRRLTSITCKK